ncbi:AAA family ATPase [Streptomyces sp. NBRC 110035]|uniref:AAA family ATPase n=1 Tax=Streptomyces sp. NBRC 110035 TaxID=1547867 RepID=UPI000699160C|nr:AAA family ATPase [Streptomyces sp. NBRC 110035]
MNHRILGLTVRNFRTLTDTKLPLGPLTVMVGPNAAGKSNVLHALDFLGDVTRKGIESAFGERGGFDALAFRGGAKQVSRISVGVEGICSDFASEETPDRYELRIPRRRLASTDRGRPPYTTYRQERFTQHPAGGAKTSVKLAKGSLTVDALRRTAGCEAELVGFVVPADLDEVSDKRYDQVRERITTQLRKTLPCHSALALSAVEMESWLMLFPDAFPKVRRGWSMRSEDRRKDFTKLAHPKEHLQRHLGKPTYRVSDSPKIMAEVVELGQVSPRPPGNNRSFRDFADQLVSWKKR